MTQPGGERKLTPIEFDFLWEQLRLGEQPYPLRVPSHGKTMDERASLRHRVDRELKAKGLKNNYGVLDPQLDRWLRLLAMNTTSVDAAHIPEFQAPPIAALAASDGASAVLAVQDAEAITMRPIFPDGLISEIVNLLPHGERGSARSITLSLDEALRTQPARVTVDQDQARRRRPLAEATAGSPQDDYANLIAQPRLRGGQIACNARDQAGRKFRSPALAWFDTVTGRYLSLARTAQDGREWVTVAAADAKTLRTRLAEMIAAVQAQAN